MTLSDPWPGFQGHGILTSRKSQKRCILGTKLLKNTNRKPYTVYRMIPLSMTLSDIWPISKSQHFLKLNIVKTAPVLKMHNRKLYLTYGMVLCLVTLTDLQTRRAGLSASAELLVLCWDYHWIQKVIWPFTCKLYFIDSIDNNANADDNASNDNADII